MTAMLTKSDVCFQVRWEALQVLCSAPPSDVLSCENWSSLQKHLSAALADPDLSVSPDTLACLLLSQYQDAHLIITYFIIFKMSLLLKCRNIMQQFIRDFTKTLRA